MNGLGISQDWTILAPMRKNLIGWEERKLLKELLERLLGRRVKIRLKTPNCTVPTDLFTGLLIRIYFANS
jgi:hypothetical protein